MENIKNYDAESEEGISLKDLLAVILDKWIVLLIFMVIGALIGAGIYAVSPHEQTEMSQEDFEAEAEQAKEKLTTEQIEQVDYLFAQYVSYKEYRKMIQNYLTDSLYVNDENVVSLIAMYYVESDINNIESCFTNLSLSMEDMEQIASILGKDSKQLEDVYRRISFYINNTNNNYVMTTDNGIIPQKSVLKVTVTAENQEQADQIMAIIETALQNEEDLLKSYDPDLNLSQIGRQYSSNVAGYMQLQQTEAIQSLNNANNQITNLQTGYIDKLDNNSKNYFNVLKNNYEEPPVQKKNSLKKMLVTGLAAGLLAALVFIILQYILNGRLKTVSDVTDRARTEVPCVIYRKKSGANLFGGWSRRLKGADLSDAAITPDLAASDLDIRLKQMNCKSAYVVWDGESVWTQETAENLQERMKEIRIHAGNPLSDTEELKLFSEAEAVVLLVQLKKTRAKVLDKWMMLGSRYSRPLAGIVVMEEC